MGFEPMRVFKDPTSLAVRRFRPLSHISICSGIISQKWLDASNLTVPEKGVY